MSSKSHHNKIYKDVEYGFGPDDSIIYPQLSRLLKQGYNFAILQRLRHPHFPATRTFALACDQISSNGTELLQRYKILTPEFYTLADLEHFVQGSMLDILHRHFFSRGEGSSILSKWQKVN